MAFHDNKEIFEDLEISKLLVNSIISNVLPRCDQLSRALIALPHNDLPKKDANLTCFLFSERYLDIF